MRTRSFSVLHQASSISRSTRTDSATIMNGWAGIKPVYPIIPGTPTVDSVSLPDVLRGLETSVIEDEVGPGLSVRPCHHVKRIGAKAFPIAQVYSSNWALESYPLYGKPDGPRKPYIWVTRNGVDPCVTAWNTAMSTGQIPDRPDTAVVIPSWFSLPDRLSELPSKIISRASEIDLAVSLIESRELPQLWQMFKGRQSIPAYLERIALIGQKGGSFTKRLSLLGKAFRSSTLGSVFGIMPTIRDASAITAALRNRHRMKKNQFVVTIKGDARYDYASYKPSSTPNTTCYKPEVKQQRTEYRVDGAFVTYHRRDYNLDFFDKAQGFIDRYLGANAAGTIWAVLPLSFAIDWILAVDDALDSLWLSQTRRFTVDYWSTTKIDLVRSCSWATAVGVTDQWEGFVPFTSAYVLPRFTMSSQLVDYNRQRRDPPSPLSSVRAKGAEIGNLFLALLIALGLRPRK